MTLHEIGLETGTDKAHLHQYCDIYEQLLGPLRHKPIRFMEHGLLTGQSAEMWRRWIYNSGAELHFVDIQDWGYKTDDPRVKIHFGDAGDESFIRPIYLAAGKFDVILDDAGHFASEQMDAFANGWEHIKPGGYYIVEDVHSVHSPQLSNAHIDIIDFFARYARNMQDERGEKGCAAPDPSNPWHAFESITMRRGLIIVRKRP